MLNQRLHYDVPADAHEIAQVEEICYSVAEFENHVLEAVRERFSDWPLLDPEPLRKQMVGSFASPNDG